MEHGEFLAVSQATGLERSRDLYNTKQGIHMNKILTTDVNMIVTLHDIKISQQSNYLK